MLIENSVNIVNPSSDDRNLVNIVNPSSADPDSSFVEKTVDPDQLAFDEVI